MPGPVGSTTPSRVALHGENARQMHEALAALPSEFREVLRLRLFEELPLREVADYLGISMSTARRRLLSGAKEYRKELEGVFASWVARRGEGR